MATLCCPASVKACAMRVTRQDECDRALDPLTTNSRLQSAGFMELGLSPDMEGGSDITVKNGCDEICIREKDMDRLKGFDVELHLCGVPLPIIEMLIDATLLMDVDGNFIGSVLRDSKTADAPNSKMLEFWSKNAKRGCSAGAQNLYLQWLLGRTTNWEISGNLTYNTGALEVVLKGYAENNPNWVPSLPGSDFASWVPGGGDPASVPDGVAPPVLPAGLSADTWLLAHQAAIQAGGPLAWQCVGALPSPLDDCAYLQSAEFASA